MCGLTGFLNPYDLSGVAVLSIAEMMCYKKSK